ncbi:MAG TPA: glucoamylase family protein, partial [Thermoanaerobaculia bacterium]|nr:glucoamylase family protein [Thermoanaerobaculia bacterium]
MRRRAADRGGRTVSPVVEDLQQRTFQWFWDTTNPQNGLVPDRWPSKSFSSVAAVGFGLTAYPVGVERGWITRQQARDRVLTTLRFFWNAPQGDAPSGVTGHRGFFYHFLDMQTGHRFEQVELSSIDTSLFMAGALFCGQYFDRDDPVEREIRDLADNLYRRVEWDWFQVHSPAITMAWFPEKGFERAEYRGYNEAHLLYILAIGSPTHPATPDAWAEWTKTHRWGEFYGYEHVNFAPLFGHQYSHVWIDFRGIFDDYMR